MSSPLVFLNLLILGQNRSHIQSFISWDVIESGESTLPPFLFLLSELHAGLVRFSRACLQAAHLSMLAMTLGVKTVYSMPFHLGLRTLANPFSRKVRDGRLLSYLQLSPQLQSGDANLQQARMSWSSHLNWTPNDLGEINFLLLGGCVSSFKSAFI